MVPPRPGWTLAAAGTSALEPDPAGSLQRPPRCAQQGAARSRPWGALFGRDPGPQPGSTGDKQRPDPEQGPAVRHSVWGSPRQRHPKPRGAQVLTGVSEGQGFAQGRRHQVAPAPSPAMAMAAFSKQVCHCPSCLGSPPCLLDGHVCTADVVQRQTQSVLQRGWLHATPRGHKHGCLSGLHLRCPCLPHPGASSLSRPLCLCPSPPGLALQLLTPKAPSCNSPALPSVLKEQQQVHGPSPPSLHGGAGLAAPASPKLLRAQGRAAVTARMGSKGSPCSAALSSGRFYLPPWPTVRDRRPRWPG